MNVLITGGAGFVGSALTGRLAAEGHRIAVVDDGSVLRRVDPSTVRGDELDVRAAVLRAARASAPDMPEPVVLQADVADPALAYFFAEVKPDAVVHLAARADVTESVRAPVRGAEVNVCGTVNVLRRCLDFGVRRFVFASSGGALYGESRRRPTPETEQPAPISPYGASKAAAELYVHTMGESGAMPCTILRLGNVYGPGPGARPAPGVIGSFARALLDGTPPVIYGDGLNERDYVHVDDVVEAFRLALHMRGDGVFNIATGTVRTVNQVLQAVAHAGGWAGEARHAPARPGEVRASCLDVRRARWVLRWRSRVEFERGVARTVRAVRARAAASEAGALQR